MKHLAVLTITLLLLGLSTTPAAGEVIFDEGFEQSTWDDDWFYDEHNWRGTKELTTDNPHSGSQCLFMKGSDWSPGGCSYMTPLVDYPLESAHVSFWIRDFQYIVGSGGDGFFKIVFTDALGRLVRLEEVPYRNDGYLSLLVADSSLNYTPSTYKIADYTDWVHISIEFTTGANTHFSVRVNDSPAIDVYPEVEFAAISQIGIGVGGQYYNTGECYLDDFSINSISSCSYITATQQNENGSGAQTILVDPAGIVADTLLTIGSHGVWSDDMTKYVFSHTSPTDGHTEIYLYDKSTADIAQLTDYNAAVSGQSSPRFRNDGQIWWVRPCGTGCSELWRMQLDGSNPQQLSNFNTSGKQMLEIDILGDTIYYTVQSSSWSPTAEVYSAIIYDDGAGNEYVDWSSADRLTNNSRRERGVRVSSDGSKLTFIQAQGSNGYSDPQQIVVMNSDGSNAQLITGGADNWSGPVWSPDGSKIACNHRRSDGTFDLYTINVDGSNPQLLTNSPGVNEYAADWRTFSCDSEPNVDPPVAAFDATPVSGLAPLTVNFADQSVGDISSWEWDFGDGTTSTEQNPAHVYTEAGTYTVMLAVTGPGGANSTEFIELITVQGDCTDNERPVAILDLTAAGSHTGGWSQGNQYWFKRGQIVKWDASTSYDPDGLAEDLVFRWSFSEMNEPIIYNAAVDDAGGWVTVLDGCQSESRAEAEIVLWDVEWVATDFGLRSEHIAFDHQSFQMGNAIAIKYYFNTDDGTDDISGDLEWALIRQAMELWQSIAYTYGDSDQGQESSSEIVRFVQTFDKNEANIIFNGFSPFFFNRTNSGLTTPSLSRNQRIVWFNSNVHWTDDVSEVGQGTAYLLHTAAHEIGHALGIGHPPNRSGLNWSIMVPGNAHQEKLGLDDIAAVWWLYGPMNESTQFQGLDFVPFNNETLPPVYSAVDKFWPDWSSNWLHASVQCPVSVVVTDPNGDSLRGDYSTIPNALYLTADVAEDSTDETLIYIPAICEGVYNFLIQPNEGAHSEDSFTLIVSTTERVDTLALNEPITNIDASGYLFSTLDTGSIHATVNAGGGGLHGVAVDLYDAEGGLIGSALTDSAGISLFPALDNGLYTVSIVKPLGYTADTSSLPIEVRGLPHQVEFALTEAPIELAQRGRGYWMHQVNALLTGKGNPHESYDDMCLYMETIRAHFNEHGLNPVTVFEVDLESGCDERFAALRTTISPRGRQTMNEKARAHLTALLLNIASGKISQWHTISEDSLSVSQAVTYCNRLITDGDTDTDELAKDIAESISEGALVPAGWIDPLTPDIVYKGGEATGLPTEFSISQNYPNPFNPSTEIRFTLPEAADVRLEVVNVMGQVVAVLVDRRLESGEHSASWDGTNVATGVYFYRIQAGDLTETKKMLLLK